MLLGLWHLIRSFCKQRQSLSAVFMMYILISTLIKIAYLEMERGIIRLCVRNMRIKVTLFYLQTV